MERIALTAVAQNMRDMILIVQLAQIQISPLVVQGVTIVNDTGHMGAGQECPAYQLGILG